MRCRLLNVAVVVAVLAMILLSAGSARAIGYWNVPGNFCQSWGYGWGAGHHACLVLGPPSGRDLCAHHEVRVPYAPRPPYEYGYGCGCDGCQSMMGEPYMTAPGEYAQPQIAVPQEQMPQEAMPQEMMPREVGLNETTPTETLPPPMIETAPAQESPVAPPAPVAPVKPLFDAPVEQ